MRRNLDIGGRKIELQGWPGDTEWMDFTAKTLKTRFRCWSGSSGRPWPVDGPLELAETASNELDGYAGLYKVFEDDIEVTEELNAHVLVHELSHAWFNRELFEERWLNEGLAEVTTVLVLEELGLPPEATRAAEPQGRLRNPAEHLGTVPLQGTAARRPRALRLRRPSQKVLTEIVDEVGTEPVDRGRQGRRRELMAYQARPARDRDGHRDQ